MTKILDDVCLLAADTARARAYLDLMVKSGLAPARAVLLTSRVGPPGSIRHTTSPLYDNLTPLDQALFRADIPFNRVDTADINDRSVCDALSAVSASIVIFAGPAGALVREPLFAIGKRFLHVHPGRLPDYRGSTPMYYSLLAEGTIGASAILLDREIDVGPLVASREFQPPTSRETIDVDYDPWMRACLLVDVLQTYSLKGTLSTTTQPKVDEGAFFVVHPVLKHLAILAKPGKSLKSRKSWN